MTTTPGYRRLATLAALAELGRAVVQEYGGPVDDSELRTPSFRLQPYQRRVVQLLCPKSYKPNPRKAQRIARKITRKYKK